MKTTPKNLVASSLERLRVWARQEAVLFNQVLQFYARQRFLFRLSKIRHIDGVLLSWG